MSRFKATFAITKVRALGAPRQVAASHSHIVRMGPKTGDRMAVWLERR
jgi:hypothetical protein